MGLTVTKCPATMRVGCVLAALLMGTGFGGCLTPQSTSCSDGRVCPAGSSCDAVTHGCVTQAQRTACAGLSNGDTCTLTAAPGTCLDGACHPNFCGDDLRTGAEQCDGNDLAGKTCAAFGYFQPTKPLACRADCTFDASGCMGVCGDGVVNDHEQCDGTPRDSKTCLDLGYNQGLPGCSALCTIEGCTTFASREADLIWSAPSEYPLLDIWGHDNTLFAVGINHLMQWSQAGFGGIWEWGDNASFQEELGLEWTAVWGTSATDVYAAGSDTSAFFSDPTAVSNRIAHWDGSAWSDTTLGVSLAVVNGMWGFSSADIYVSGKFSQIENEPGGAVLEQVATILHWDGHSWSPFPLSTTAEVNAEWGSGAQNIFAVGTSVSHWDGHTWSLMTVPTSDFLDSIWGSGANDAYAVGRNGTIIHWDGSSWNKMESGTTDELTSVSGSGAGDVFVQSRNALLHLRDGAWERLSTPTNIGTLTGVRATAERIFLLGSSSEAHLERTTVTCVGPEQLCDDGWDNDCDGLADGADPDCAGHVIERCANGADDDHNGLIDCADPACVSFPNCITR